MDISTAQRARVLTQALPYIKQYAGKTVVMMTQVSYEGSDMTVYQVGHDLKERFGLMEAYNMTMEAAVTKLMWALGQSQRPEEIRRLFYRPVQCDIIR